MRALDLEEAMGRIDDKIILEVVSMMNNENRSRKKTKVFRTILIAAVITTMLTAAAYAAGRLINSPQQAWKVAQQEVARWQELGLLSSEVELPEGAGRISEFPETAGDDYWFGRIWPHRYNVIGDYAQGDKYSFSMDVDTASGKITSLTIEAAADETDTLDREMDINGTTYYFYRNYDDIFPADMTVDRFCTLLAQYWGFDGYDLSGTADSFYGYDTSAPAGDTLLSDLESGVYLTVYFEGDQSGVPMYVELHQFPGRVGLIAGTNHGVG